MGEEDYHREYKSKKGAKHNKYNRKKGGKRDYHDDDHDDYHHDDHDDYHHDDYHEDDYKHDKDDYPSFFYPKHGHGRHGRVYVGPSPLVPLHRRFVGLPYHRLLNRSRWARPAFRYRPYGFV